jgi:hypothetical protein
MFTLYANQSLPIVVTGLLMLICTDWGHIIFPISMSNLHSVLVVISSIYLASTRFQKYLFSINRVPLDGLLAEKRRNRYSISATNRSYRHRPHSPPCGFRGRCVQLKTVFEHRLKNRSNKIMIDVMRLDEPQIDLVAMSKGIDSHLVSAIEKQPVVRLAVDQSPHMWPHYEN